MRFESPVVFLALILLAPAAWWSARGGARGWARLAVLAALAAALARPVREREVERRAGVVVARDVSSSVRPGELDGAPAGDAAIEFREPARGVARAAAAAGPGGAVTLVTDARWTPEEVAAAVREAGLAGVPVYAWQPAAAAPDAAVSDVLLAVPAREGEAAEIHAVVRGEPGTRGEALLLIDDVPSGRAAWQGPETRLRFPATLSAGFRRFAVRLEAESDGDPRNNVALGGAEVAGAPRVLLVEGVPGAAEGLARALAAQGVACARAAAGAPAAWDDHAAVVLVRATPAQLGGSAASLAAWVAGGGGLLAVVAPEEAAAWQGTPPAELLPLTFRDPDPRAPEPGPPAGDPAPSDEAPRILLVLAVDRSGSMHGERLLKAKEAALAAAATLGDGDQVAVLAFDTEATWALEPTAATAHGTIEDRVSRLQPGGGTDVHAALAAIADRVIGLKIPVRHVLLLTDGDTPMADFRRQVERLAADGVTVSTVGLGSAFDGPLLANIATWGKGRFYFTEREGEIPRIFTTEARRAAAGAPAPRAKPAPRPTPAPTPPAEFLPVSAVDADPAIEGLEAWPDLGGACGLDLRPGARLILRAGPRPLLAVARRSLGRAAAFAAPLDGPRAAKWTGWERLPRFAAQLVRTLMRPEAAGPSVEVVAEGDARRVIVRAPGSATIAATLDGAPLALAPRAGGAFEALLPAPAAWPALSRLDVATDAGHASAAVAWSWPQELAPRGRAALPFLPATPDNLARRPPAIEMAREELFAFALALAAAALLAEVWLRRLRQNPVSGNRPA